jgi:MerR family transcriptional regulator/heat shock protein HspR
MARAAHTGDSKARSGAGGRVTLFTREVFCTLCGISAGQLTTWEYEELIRPARVFERESGGVERLYGEREIKRARLIRSLGEDLEVNIAGIGIILRLLEQMGR